MDSISVDENEGASACFRRIFKSWNHHNNMVNAAKRRFRENTKRIHAAKIQFDEFFNDDLMVNGRDLQDSVQFTVELQDLLWIYGLRCMASRHTSQICWDPLRIHQDNVKDARCKSTNLTSIQTPGTTAGANEYANSNRNSHNADNKNKEPSQSQVEKLSCLFLTPGPRLSKALCHTNICTVLLQSLKHLAFKSSSASSWLSSNVPGCQQMKSEETRIGKVFRLQTAILCDHMRIQTFCVHKTKDICVFDGIAFVTH